MHFEESIIVRKSPEQVWNFFEDITNLPKWDRGVARVELTSSGPLGVGTTFDTVGYGERGRMSYRVSEANRNHSYTVVTHSSFFRQAQWHFELQAVPDGTRIVCTTDFSLRRRYLALAPILFFSVKRGAIKTDLEYLKRVLEAA